MSELDDSPRPSAALDATPPLEGIKVADFSRVLAGPLATMMLADLGAEVVKIERPGTGDDTRQWGPPWTPRGSAYFESVNRSKRSVALDLKNPSHLEIARQLALEADIVVENFTTGTMDRLGLGYEQLAAENPGLIYCSITGFGSGAGARMAGYDFLVQAVGGLMSITGAADGEPMKVGVALVDVLTGKDAVIGVLAALQERHRSGRGQLVEVSLLTSLLGSLVNQASSYLMTGRSPGRMGNAHPSIAPYELLRCTDGAIAIACGNDGQFARLAAQIGRPELATDPRFATNPARVAHRAELVAELEAGLAGDTASGWVRRLTAAGVPTGEVGDIGSAIELAERLGLSPTVHLGPDHPRQVRHPISFSRSGIRTPSPPPDLAQPPSSAREH